MFKTSTLGLSSCVQILVALSAELMASIETPFGNISASQLQLKTERYQECGRFHLQPSLGATKINNSHLIRSEVCITDVS
jgi:hypothetical protein